MTPDCQSCLSCGAIYSWDEITTTAYRFTTDGARIYCPYCHMPLLDLSTINQPRPVAVLSGNDTGAGELEDDVPMPEAFREFISQLEI